MTREEWKARYRAMRMVRAMRESGPRRAGDRRTASHPDLPQLLQLRTERLRPAWSPRRRRVNAAVSSIMMLLIFALLTAALLSSEDRQSATAGPILVSAPLEPDPMAAATPI